MVLSALVDFVLGWPPWLFPFLAGAVVMLLIDIHQKKPKFIYPEGSMLQPHRPFAIRAINYFGSAAAAIGILWPSLDSKDLVKQALEGAGLDTEPAATDKGSYGNSLEILLEVLENEARLTTLGRLVAQGMIAKSLTNRFLLDHKFEIDDRIRKEKVKPPVVILGLPRTGTTFLHGLLSQDRRMFRSPMHWELTCLKKQEKDRGERIKHATNDLENFLKLAPNFRAFHDISAIMPEECTVIFQQGVMAQSMSFCLNAFTFDRWLMDQGFDSIMRRHRRMLQYLQFDEKEIDPSSRETKSRDWLLKSPQYLMMLQELIDEYPKAQIVWTHRDPTQVLGSVMALSTKLTGMVTDDVDPKRIGRNMLANTGTVLMKALEARHRLEESGHGHMFCDVTFKEICDDPMDVVRRIYKHFQRQLSEEAERAMRSFIDTHKRFKHGKPLYDLQQTFGVTKEDTALGPFVAYRERFFTPETGTAASNKEGKQKSS